ncbi:uncharacterized protein VNE69_05158 [Vairimorpha necatrix]|uniref:Uncharacterized protein n=1 Tax=Vairimorpha necatrix TaxID=6039 RepID=A0AAX4JC77_9MICR
MGILDYYTSENVKICKNMTFDENLEINSNFSYFSVYDAYFNDIEDKKSYDIWTEVGILEDVEIKEVPLNFANLYKKIGNKHMYKRFMKEHYRSI